MISSGLVGGAWPLEGGAPGGGGPGSGAAPPGYGAPGNGAPGGGAPGGGAITVSGLWGTLPIVSGQ